MFFVLEEVAVEGKKEREKRRVVEAEMLKHVCSTACVELAKAVQVQ